MKRPSLLRRCAALIAMLGMLGAAGCADGDKKSKASDDVAALQKLVDVPVKLASARWEIVGTPEYDGGVPGRTDYMTLIAEIEPLEPATPFAAGAGDTDVYLIPEVARPWLSDRFRRMLEQHRNSNVNLAALPACRAYRTTIRSSGRAVGGFACASGGRVLVYLDVS